MTADAPAEPLRFAILTHDHPQLHWDLVIEKQDAERCWTWRLPSPPAVEVDLPAMRLPDHRRLYLDYEGPVSGGRGTVERWDGGSCRPVSFSGQELRWFLRGSRILGDIILRHDAADEPDGWRFIYRPRPGRSQDSSEED